MFYINNYYALLCVINNSYNIKNNELTGVIYPFKFTRGSWRPSSEASSVSRQVLDSIRNRTSIGKQKTIRLTKLMSNQPR